MNALETHIEELNKSDFDHSNINQINKDYQKLATSLLGQNEEDLAYLANLEREVFGFQKSFRIEKNTGNISGISWMISGEKTLEDGTKESFFWPDITRLKDADFRHIAKRYLELTNLYAKTEFGILLYFKSPFSEHKHNDFKKELASLLMDLSNLYLDKYKKNSEHISTYSNFCNAIRGCVHISLTIKESDLFIKSITLLLDEFLTIEVSTKGSQSQLMEILQLFLDYYKSTSNLLIINQIYEKCFMIARDSEAELPWSCISISDMCLTLQEKSQIKSQIDWFEYKATIYELLADEASEAGNVNAIPGLIDSALSIYQKLKDNDNIKRLEKKYEEVRNEVSFSQFSQQIPADSIDRIKDHIQKTITENDSDGIIETISFAPMFANIRMVKSSVEEVKKYAVLQSIIPLSIIDRSGNKIAQYNPNEGEYDSNFWQTYSFHFQFGMFVLYELFIQAIQSNKLTYSSVESYLSKTWYFDSIERKYRDRVVNIYPKETLLPPIKLLFDELQKSFADPEYSVNLIPIIDSLTLKIESLLRYFCEIIGIHTFKRVKGTDIIMEKNLEELLSDLHHRPEGDNQNITNFIEDDRIFIKYFLTEKAGENLRNEIAHGLMEISDYKVSYIPILFSIILKISKYKFIKSEGNN